MTRWRDDLGHPVELPAPVRRVVSLVPSLTEAVAVSAPGLLAGATDWCTHPAGLTVTRVRGTKNPERAAIISLAPDLVIANKEENRELDVTRLREAGLGRPRGGVLGRRPRGRAGLRACGPAASRGADLA
jgi:hypothetical protein